MIIEHIQKQDVEEDGWEVKLTGNDFSRLIGGIKTYWLVSCIW